MDTVMMKTFVVCGQCAGWMDPNIGCPACQHGYVWREKGHKADLNWVETTKDGHKTWRVEANAP